MAKTTATRTKLGPVSGPERARYRARILDDAEWGRPTPTTAAKICTLVGVDPRTLRAARDHGDEADRVAAQAFTVALDTVIMFGDRMLDEDDEAGAQLTFNAVFDALARYWSLRYQSAQLRGATTSYDMAEATLVGAGGDDGGTWRELVVAGVNVEAIWDLLTRQVEPSKHIPHWQPHIGLARLYVLRRVSGKGHSRGRKVRLHQGRLLDDVRYEILRDAQYERPEHCRLLLAKDKAPALSPRQEVCEERPYDVVNINQRSRDVLDFLETSRLRFYVEQFREDFEALDEFVRTQPEPAYQRQTSLRARRHGYDRVDQTVRALRPVYEQTAGLADLSRDTEGRAYVEIRSRFFRAVNRRFNAADFWPEHAPSDLRERWFGVDDVSEYGLILVEEADDLVEVGGDYPDEFAERDISSSQTQLLAAFLGLDHLEAVAGSQSPKFKVYLAQRLWDIHERDRACLCGTCSGVLKPGYAGPDDKHLIEFIKELWMRRNYGGKFGQTILGLAKDPATYGPGWNSDVFATGGVKKAEAYFERFLAELPEWARAVTTFLEACQYIGSNADAVRGVVFTDPLDGAAVMWNPIKRAKKKLPVGKRGHLEASLSGTTKMVGKAERFIARPWEVDSRELANRVAPCLVHTLDAYFNALVLEYLDGCGVTQVVAVHDGWFVPWQVRTDLRDDESMPLSGAQILERAIEYVGQEWLSGVRRVPDPDKPLRYYTTVPPDETRPGLGVVYDWFVGALKSSPYEDFALEVRTRWRKRVADKRWPQFAAS
jgi:hypothetical protein